jgi:hypothetical protein
MGAGLKKDHRVSRVGPGGFLNAFFFLLTGAVSSLFSLLWKPCPCSEVKEGHGDVQEGHSLDQLVVACVCKLRDAHFMCFV